jgi:23S rRNA pseudouridine1911/1915/1917 synthase
MQIIFEDNHLLAINKPAGWLVQADRTGDQTLTDWGKNYLKEKYAKPGAVFLTPTHRIDRPVSGAVLLARTDKALGRLTEAFRTRAVAKTYWAKVLQAPPASAGTLRHWLLKNEQRNTVQTFDYARPGAKECLLEYEVVGNAGPHICLKINPLTGRSHQIRAQLAAMDCPIVGDLKYGAPAPLPDASIALHCRSMGLLHPVRKEPMVVEAAVPEAEIWREWPR